MDEHQAIVRREPSRFRGREIDTAGDGFFATFDGHARGGEGEVFVSSTLNDLVAGSGITFSDRGAHELKGVPDEWHIFSVTG